MCNINFHKDVVMCFDESDICYDATEDVFRDQHKRPSNYYQKLEWSLETTNLLSV